MYALLFLGVNQLDSNGIIKISVLVIYLLLMVAVGAVFYKKTSSFSDYILGGRKLNSWTAALSAQASDMSGWLLLGLPGAAYLAGVESSWIAIGLAVGTYINWKVIARRLRSYTEISGDSLTLSDFFENRFRDNTHILRVTSGIIILVFFSVYTSAQFSAGAKLFEMLVGINYQLALLIGAIVIISYTFLGGFMAVAITDFVQGILMFLALIIVPFVAIAELGGFGSVISGMQSIDPNFMSLFKTTGGTTSLSIIAIISSLAWGGGYFGQPHILARFMAIKSAEEVKKARLIAMVWVIIALGAAVFVGMVGSVYFADAPLGDAETVFMIMVNAMFNPVVAGVLLAAILAASMSTADSQLLVTASTISEDFYKQFFRKEATDKELIWVGRLAVIIVAVVAALIAIDPNSSVFGLVSYAWAGFGAGFGPVIILALFWKRANKWGAIAGLISGAATVVIWPTIARTAQAAIFQLYELVPAFIISMLLAVVVSLMTKEPCQEIKAEFEEMKSRL
jgi:sodium/proline symporter